MHAYKNIECQIYWRSSTTIKQKVIGSWLTQNEYGQWRHTFHKWASGSTWRRVQDREHRPRVIKTTALRSDVHAVDSEDGDAAAVDNDSTDDEMEVMWSVSILRIFRRLNICECDVVNNIVKTVMTGRSSQLTLFLANVSHPDTDPTYEIAAPVWRRNDSTFQLNRLI